MNIVGGGQFPKITAKSTDDFEVGVTLGTGPFGRVRFATHKVPAFPVTPLIDPL